MPASPYAPQVCYTVITKIENRSSTHGCLTAQSEIRQSALSKFKSQPPVVMSRKVAFLHKRGEYEDVCMFV